MPATCRIASWAAIGRRYRRNHGVGQNCSSGDRQDREAAVYMIRDSGHVEARPVPRHHRRDAQTKTASVSRGGLVRVKYSLRIESTRRRASSTCLTLDWLPELWTGSHFRTKRSPNQEVPGRTEAWAAHIAQKLNTSLTPCACSNR